MSIAKMKLRPRQLLSLLGIAIAVSGNILITEAVFSQTASPIRILRVTSASGTTFKQKENWYKQSSQIQSDDRCSVGVGDKFFITSIQKRNISDMPLPPKNNYERISDYWEVTFEAPVNCKEKNGNSSRTWIVYKNHVQELRAIPVR
jgi:hypothetical protein